MRFLREMRVKHYIKNFLIFLPLFFSGEILNLQLFAKTTAGFLAFSFLASAVYIMNDLKDLACDRQNEVKRKRPLASGEITVRQAMILLCISLIAAFLTNLSVNNSPKAWGILFLYLIINLAYSYGLKNVPLVDISIIGGGFMLRVLFGGVVGDVTISGWMYLTVMAMSFYLAFGKRRNEIKKSGCDGREVLKHYSESFLDKMMYLSLTLAIVFYSIWCIGPNAIMQDSGRPICTVPIVILICMKYSMDIESESSGDPAEVLLGDKVLLVLILLYGLLIMWLAYGSRILGMMG